MVSKCNHPLYVLISRTTYAFTFVRVKLPLANVRLYSWIAKPDCIKIVSAKCKRTLDIQYNWSYLS